MQGDAILDARGVEVHLCKYVPANCRPPDLILVLANALLIGLIVNLGECVVGMGGVLVCIDGLYCSLSAVKFAAWRSGSKLLQKNLVV